MQPSFILGCCSTYLKGFGLVFQEGSLAEFFHDGAKTPKMGQTF